MKNRVTIGIDEVGRGALAGPLVLAAVACSGRISWRHPALGAIRDSKKLSPRRRELWYRYLTEHPRLSWRVTRLAPRVVDELNVSRAANRGAVRLAGELAALHPQFRILLDGGLSLGSAFPYEAIIKGDEKIPAIAAASIIAKVTRDRMMRRLDASFPAYGFAAHKGYGTKLHQARIARYGPSVIHRRTFLRSLLSS